MSTAAEHDDDKPFARIEAESRAEFARLYPNGVEPADPMPELTAKVSKAIDEHANGHEDEAADLFPGAPLNPADPHDAQLVQRLQNGDGRLHEIKLHVAKDGSHWAVRDFDAFSARVDAEEAADGGP